MSRRSYKISRALLKFVIRDFNMLSEERPSLFYHNLSYPCICFFVLVSYIMISLLVSCASYRCLNIKYRLCKEEKINNNIVCLRDLVEFFCDSDLLCKTWLIWFLFDLDSFAIIDTVMES